MTRDEVYKHLCWHDKRSPYHVDYDDEEDIPREKGCGCDPCFHDKDQLAVFTLDLMTKSENLLKAGLGVLNDMGKT